MIVTEVTDLASPVDCYREYDRYAHRQSAHQGNDYVPTLRNTLLKAELKASIIFSF